MASSPASMWFQARKLNAYCDCTSAPTLRHLNLADSQGVPGIVVPQLAGDNATGSHAD